MPSCTIVGFILIILAAYTLFRLRKAAGALREWRFTCGAEVSPPKVYGAKRSAAERCGASTQAVSDSNPFYFIFIIKD